MNTLLLSAFLACAPSSFQDVETESLSARVERFDEALDPVNRISGVLLVVRADDVLLHEAYGMADYELGVPNTTSTRFCVASITKVMTRLVAWQLLIEGKVQAGSTLDELLPGFPRGDEITYMQLMQHRAGIPHRVTTPADTWRPMSAADVAARAAEHELLFPPGSRSSYSSAGYSVLARVVEIIEGEPFADVLRRRVFEPAGMKDTFDVDHRTLLAGRARSYVPGRDGLLNAPLQDLSFLVGAGSLVTTAEDLVRFLKAFRDGTFGQAAWFSTQGPGPAKWTGASNGYHAFLDYDPETETVFVFTGNTFGGGAGQLRTALPKLLAGEDVAPRPRPAETVEVDAARLAEYVGRYESRPGSYWTVELRGNELLIADSVVLPISQTEFYFQNWSKVFTFVRASEDDPWSIRNVGWDGEEETWPRVDS